MLTWQPCGRPELSLPILVQSVTELTLACGGMADAMGTATVQMAAMARALTRVHHETLQWRLATEARRVKDLCPGRRRQRGMRRLRRMVDTYDMDSRADRSV